MPIFLFFWPISETQRMSLLPFFFSAKQQWLFLPTGDASNEYFVIPNDHLGDMATRALSSAILDTAGGYKSTSVDLYDPVRRPDLRL